MISVEEARAKVLAGIRPVGAEQVSVMQAGGRVLAEPVAARVSHPPVDVSAMDGYAVRAADVATAPAKLALQGESAAGRPYDGTLRPGCTVRIFTGAQIPAGADAVIMQEDAARDGEAVEFRVVPRVGQHIRRAGLDFAAGQTLLEPGRLLTARDVGLIAATNVPWVLVKRRPRVAILSTGDEIKMPGDPLAPAQIIGSNGLALVAFVEALGGEAILLGTALDTMVSLQAMLAGARGADLLLTSGGASVGDYDLVKDAIGAGMALDFYKVAMRPGKPLMFGRMGEMPVLGLPGNPVSALVCAEMFLGPAMRRMLGLAAEVRTVSAVLGRDLPANDLRQDHLRASLAHDEAGRLIAMPFDTQDSAMLASLARADALLIRPPHAPAATAGDPVRVIPLGV